MLDRAAVAGHHHHHKQLLTLAARQGPHFAFDPNHYSISTMNNLLLVSLLLLCACAAQQAEAIAQTVLVLQTGRHVPLLNGSTATYNKV